MKTVHRLQASSLLVAALAVALVAALQPRTLQAGAGPAASAALPAVTADLSVGNWIRRPDPVLEPGLSGSWDASSVSGPEVIHDGSQYRMWYRGQGAGKGEIGYATSGDGITWTKYRKNPVLRVGEPGSWDGDGVRAPAVLFDGAIWKMWYTGYSSAAGSQIGYATSPNGIEWTKHPGNPVLTPGPSGAWDDDGVFSPHVMLKQGTYHMWYSGADTASDYVQIGYATSPDGTHWTEHGGNPVLQPGPSDDPFIVPLEVYAPSVVELFGEYQMWYAEERMVKGIGYECIILHRVSSDRIHWTKGDLALPGSLSLCDYDPSVILHRGSLKMWFATSGGIGYAGLAIAPHRAYCPIIVR